MKHLPSWEADLKPRRISPEEWEAHRNHIRDLYLGAGTHTSRRCLDVRKTLYENYGFYATYNIPPPLTPGQPD